jgi:hypothetical protein
MKGRSHKLTIVATPQTVCPWGTTYRIHEDGEAWRVANGSRVRAWSTYEAAQGVIDRMRGREARERRHAR